MLPELLSDLRYRLRALFRRRTVERELDEELRFHLQHEAEKYRREGMPAEDAMRRARVAFGGVEVAKEASRDGRGLAFLEAVAQDLRYAVRALRRSPGFTIGVMVTLALGIGANAAMFGIVDRLLFRTPAYLTDAGRVHRVYFRWQVRGRERTTQFTEYARYLDLRRWTTAFDAMAGFSSRDVAIGTGPEATELRVATVSASLFDFFDARPALGRFFTAEEDSIPEGRTVAVLGYGYWQTRYGGRADVLDRTIRIGTTDYTVIGVAPRGFVGVDGGVAPVVFVPITAFAPTLRGGTAQADYTTSYNWSWMKVLVRRRPGVSLAQASADLSNAFLRSYEKEQATYPEPTPAAIARPTALAAPVQAERGPNQSDLARVAVWVWGVAAIVLLIACANVANLMLARAIRRRREVAVRLALGVSRGRLARQLVTESLLLAASGGLAGVCLGYWGGAVIRATVLPEGSSGYSLVDPRTLWFSLGLTLLAGLLTGLAPVLRSRRTDLAGSLKTGARDGGARRSRARSTLLLLQGALSVVLLVGAGLFVRSLWKVEAVPLGFDADSVLYIYPNQRGIVLNDADAAALRRRLLDAVRTVPGVERAALGLTVPFWDTWTERLFVRGVDSVARLGMFTLQGASPDYLATVGTRILRGRNVSERDRADAPPIVLVTRSMARALWPGQDPLGKCLRMNADTAPCITVVGVTQDVHQNSITDDARLHYFLPIEQFHPESAVLFARVRGDPAAMAVTLRRRLQPLMPGDGYLTVTPMRDIVNPGLRSWRLGALMFLLFGGLALALAAIGLYSVLAYDVAQRTHELGVRLALGARVGDVVRLVVRDGIRFALIGIAAGGLVAFWAGHWIEPLLFSQSPHDPLVLGPVALVLLLVALAASAFPALRATRVDPTVALKTE